MFGNDIYEPVSNLPNVRARVRFTRVQIDLPGGAAKVSAPLEARIEDMQGKHLGKTDPPLRMVTRQVGPTINALAVQTVVVTDPVTGQQVGPVSVVGLGEIIAAFLNRWYDEDKAAAAAAAAAEAAAAAHR
jgi:hypothetical protein